MNYREFLSNHVASSLLKQRRLGEFLEEHGNPDWSVDLSVGTASFGKAGTYPLQVVGTESQVDQSWMWGWANAQSGLEPHVLYVANMLKKWGDSDGVSEFSQPTLPMTENLGHQLALIASGACQADAYYRGPYEGGVLYFTLTKLPLRERPPLSSGAEITLLASVVSQFDVDHRAMAHAFFDDQNYPITQDGSQITATRKNGEQIVVTFDDGQRITNLETTMKPGDAIDEAPAAKPWWRFGM